MTHDIVDRIVAQWHLQMPDLNTESMAPLNRVLIVAKLLSEAIDQDLEKFELTSGEFDVLATLRRQKAPHTVNSSDLATAVMLSAGALTNRIDGMVTKGLVTRQATPADRRRVMISLSPRAKGLVKQALKSRAELFELITATLTEREISSLSVILRKLVLSMDHG